MSGLFGIGVSGLAAAQAGLVTTGHNIANSGTDGYHRQAVVQSNAVPVFNGSGFIGQGVNVDSVRRVYDSFLDSQANRAEAQSAYYAAFNAQVGQIDSLLSDPSAGLAPQLQSFFATVNDVASSPASVPSRQAMISSANALASRFQALDNRLVEINAGVNSQIASTVTGVNAYAREIASLNQRIAATGASPSQPPNDLLDRRDQLVSELNKLVGASTVTQADGTVSVSIGSGQALVVGSQSYSLGTTQSAEVPDQTDVTYQTAGAAVVLGQSTLTQGSLGALLSFRSSTLVDAQNQLGRIAAGLAETFNAQHALGQDLVGGTGANFFAPPAATVTAHKSNNPLSTGTVTASITSATNLTSSNYRVVYNGTGFDVTRLSDNTTQTYSTLPPPAPQQVIDGLTITASGTLNAGDSFLVEPTRYTAKNLTVAISDPTKVAAATPMLTSAGVKNIGTATIGTVTTPPGALAQKSVTITFTSPTTFDTTGVMNTGVTPNVAADVTGVAYTSPGTISYNGWTVQITGTPAAGDTFTISPTGPSDGRNALALANLQVQSTLNGGTASYQAAYGQLTSSVGNTAADVEIASKAQETIALSSRQSQQSLSGVNLDEEAANLMRYQQAYQASSKVIEVAQTMFETILRLGS
jgi:flagellar hook-associated protein 1 FlgK